MWPMIFMLAGSAVQAGGGIFGATQAIKNSKYQQDILDYQSNYERAATEIGVEKIKHQVKQVKSAQRAATAASGFQTGDATELGIETELQGEIDIALLRSAGGIEQLRLKNAGTMARSAGYGQAAGLYGRASGTLLNTGMGLATRAGWFEPSTATKTKPLLSSGYGPQR